MLTQLRPLGYMGEGVVTSDKQWHLSRFRGNIQARVLLFSDVGGVFLKDYFGLYGVFGFLDRIHRIDRIFFFFFHSFLMKL